MKPTLPILLLAAALGCFIAGRADENRAFEPQPSPVPGWMSLVDSLPKLPDILPTEDDGLGFSGKRANIWNQLFIAMPPSLTSFQDCLEKLPKFVGKPVITPEGMEAFFAQYEMHSFSIDTFAPNDLVVSKYSRFLDGAVMRMGMTWSYDTARDAIVLDFPWHTGDARGNPELMKILTGIPPVTYRDEDLKHFKPDPWRIAFDALLGKPENFSNTWKVRMAADDKTFFGLILHEPVQNFFTGYLTDETGQPHLLVMNIQVLPIIPSVDTISYYLFDRNGKFEQGGLYDDGYIGFGGGSVELDAGKKRMTHRIDSYDLVFAVEKGRFVLQKILYQGQQLEPADPRNGPGKMLLTVDGS